MSMLKVVKRESPTVVCACKRLASWEKNKDFDDFYSETNLQGKAIKKAQHGTSHYYYYIAQSNARKQDLKETQYTKIKKYKIIIIQRRTEQSRAEECWEVMRTCFNFNCPWARQRPSWNLNHHCAHNKCKKEEILPPAIIIISPCMSCSLFFPLRLFPSFSRIEL